MNGLVALHLTNALSCYYANDEYSRRHLKCLFSISGF